MLVQGPHIIELYKKWFTAGDAARSFLAMGMADVADQLMVQAKRDVQTSLTDVKAGAFAAGNVQLKFGNGLAFRVTAQLPELADPLMDRDDFDAVPPNVSFDEYMTGYFKDMITHEMGHNLGLRHNFRGTLGAADGAPTPGGVSRSIMDYMGRDYRFLDQIGEYDRMAIAYGYTGAQPAHADWFCTDEDTGAAASPNNSAECSKDDATDDPFSFFEASLARSIGDLTNRQQTTQPNWTVADMSDELSATLGGLLNYAASAEKTGPRWTNFFGKLDRPADSSGVKAYVVGRIKAQLCDPSLQDVLANKASQAARDAVTKNIANLKLKVVEVAKAYKQFTAADFECR